MTRATSTNLDVLLERRMNDFWNIEGHSDRSDSWTGFTPIRHNGRKNSRWVGMVRGETDEETNDTTKRKTKVGYRETEA